MASYCNTSGDAHIKICYSSTGLYFVTRPDGYAPTVATSGINCNNNDLLQTRILRLLGCQYVIR